MHSILDIKEAYSERFGDVAEQELESHVKSLKKAVGVRGDEFAPEAFQKACEIMDVMQAHPGTTFRDAIQIVEGNMEPPQGQVIEVNGNGNRNGHIHSATILNQRQEEIADAVIDDLRHDTKAINHGIRGSFAQGVLDKVAQKIEAGALEVGNPTEGEPEVISTFLAAISGQNPSTQKRLNSSQES
jgi:hypothetical protein